MPTTFPTTKQSISNPSGSGTLSSENHSQIHAQANDTLAALQDKVGITSDTAVTSHDYLITRLLAGTARYAADAGANDSYAVTLSPAPTAYTTGQVVNFKANTANTGAATLNVNSLGAKTIKKLGSIDLSTNDILASQIVSVIYDGTNFQLLSPIITPGSYLQTVSSFTGAVATGTTQLPIDDTIPQITEGTEFMTLAITPTSTTNKLLIEHIGSYEIDTADRNISAALFQDATVNALAAVGPYANVSRNRVNLILRHEMVAGTTSSTTFRIRAGANNTGTITFNGSGGTRLFGGVMASSIRITEIKG